MTDDKETYQCLKEPWKTWISTYHVMDGDGRPECVTLKQTKQNHIPVIFITRISL
jgi:DNA-binding response OmpR family regulator